MTNINPNTLNQEQIKKELVKGSNFYMKLRTFLERDEYGFFKAKNKRTLESKLQKSDSMIKELTELKLKSEQAIKALVTKRKDLQNQNKKLRESLITNLGISKS